MLISKDLVRLVKREFRSEWSSESDDYINKWPVKKARNATKAANRGEKEHLQQKFNNTYHYDIQTDKRRKREVFAYGVENKLVNETQFRKIKAPKESQL